MVDYRVVEGLLAYPSVHHLMKLKAIGARISRRHTSPGSLDVVIALRPGYRYPASRCKATREILLYIPLLNDMAFHCYFS
jgi:hypothetical protein